MKSFNDTILRKTATLNNTLLVGALWLVMAFFVMPEAMRQNSLYVNGAKRIGSPLRFSSGEFYNLIGQYGEKGRQHFIAIELTADVFYAVVTSLFLCFLMVWSFNFSKNKHLKQGCLIWLALFILLAFLLENMGLVSMLLAYPDMNQGIHFLTAIFSLLKIASVAASLGIVAWNLAIYDIRKHKCELPPDQENTVAEQK